MSAISDTFSRLKKEKKKGLIVFVTAGDPDLATTEKLVPELFKAGADLVELGIPFSDPLADGPTIQASFLRALKGETTLKKVLASVKKIKAKSEGPIALMSAYNLIYKYGRGPQTFVKDAKSAGVDGVILPDLLPEESREVIPYFRKSDIDTIFLAAPTSNEKRIKTISQSSTGFLYYISITGITGKQKPSAADVDRKIKIIKKVTKLPVACGFGISAPEEARDIAAVSDAVIVGSALVKIFSPKGSKSERIARATEFVAQLRNAIDKI